LWRLVEYRHDLEDLCIARLEHIFDHELDFARRGFAVVTKTLDNGALDKVLGLPMLRLANGAVEGSNTGTWIIALPSIVARKAHVLPVTVN
jgi:hypothetical protein